MFTGVDQPLCADDPLLVDQNRIRQLRRMIRESQLRRQDVRKLQKPLFACERALLIEIAVTGKNQLQAGAFFEFLLRGPETIRFLGLTRAELWMPT